VSDASPEQFELVDRMLEELMIKHFELAHMVEEYREMVERARDRPWDLEGRKLARALPGARYHVASTFVREHVLKIEAELQRLFPADGA
jgi:hypothetical protein